MRRRATDIDIGPPTHRLFGVFSGVDFDDLDDVAYREVQRIFKRVEKMTDAVTCFRNVQFLILHAAWDPSYLGKTMEFLKKWMNSCDEVPFLAKQFASYFATFQKEGLIHAELVRNAMKEDVVDSQPDTEPFFTDESVDFLVKEHVTELMRDSPAGGKMEIIVEHMLVLTRDMRIEVYVWFLHYIGPRGKNVSCETITHSLGTLWERFPLECLPVIYKFCRQVILNAWAAYEANKGIRSDELFHALYILTEMWMIVSSMEDNKEESTLATMLEGMGIEATADMHDQAEQILEQIFIPFLVDIICTSLVASDATLELASLLDKWENELLWKNLRSPHATHLAGVHILRVDIPWYIHVYTTHAAWKNSFSDPYRMKTQFSETELREDFVAKALPHVEFKTFLEVKLVSGSALSDEHWAVVRSTLACRVMSSLESVYFQSDHLQNAREELTVAVAQSCWMLPYIGPEKAAHFLQSLMRHTTELPTRPRTIQID